MTETGFGAEPFRTLHVSGEETHCPEAADLCAAGRWLAARGARSGAVSVRHGNRVVVSGRRALGDLDLGDLVEVADYDAPRNTLLVLGQADPPESAPLHWLVARWRPEVNAVLQAALPAPTSARPGALALVEDGLAGTPAPRSDAPPLAPVASAAQGVLRALRSAPVAYHRAWGYVAVGASLDAAKAALVSVVGEASRRGSNGSPRPSP